MLVLFYRVPQKKLPLVVLFKLDHHISGTMSNQMLLKFVGQNLWYISNCFGAKKVTKIEVCREKHRKNCECCPGHYLIVVIVVIVVRNQRCD